MGWFGGKSGDKSERSVDSKTGKAGDSSFPKDSKTVNVKTGTDKSFSFAVHSKQDKGDSKHGFKVLESKDSKGNKYDHLGEKYVGGPKSKK